MKKVVGPDVRVRASESSERPAFASLYAVAGRFISIESTDPYCADLFRNYFSGWHVDPVAAHASEVRPHATIWVTATAARPASSTDLEAFEVAEGGTCRTDHQTYFFESNGSAIRADSNSSQQVEIWIGNTPEAREPAALARLIFNASMTAMRRCGLFELHAAGVVAPDNNGMLIIGPSGSAKSTLATQLAASGWQYLSDDKLLLHVDNNVVHARALRRVFALAASAFSSNLMSNFDSMTTAPLPFDSVKRRFEPQAVFPEKFVETCVPRTLFFSRITNASQSQTQQLTHSETMARLIRMCPWSAYDKPVAHLHLRALGQMARQAKGYELRAGTDLLGDPVYASAFLQAARS